jgi:hypothetical protein
MWRSSSILKSERGWILATHATIQSTKTISFRRGHLVRLRDFNHTALDEKLARVKSTSSVTGNQFAIEFLDDSVRPPVGGGGNTYSCTFSKQT